MYESSYCPIFSPVFGVISVQDFGHSNRCVVVIVSQFDFHFPDDIRHGEFFHMFIFHLYIVIEKVFVKDFGPFFNLVISLLLNFKSSFYILANSPL